MNSAPLAERPGPGWKQPFLSDKIDFSFFYLVTAASMILAFQSIKTLVMVALIYFELASSCWFKQQRRQR